MKLVDYYHDLTPGKKNSFVKRLMLDLTLCESRVRNFLYGTCAVPAKHCYKISKATHNKVKMKDLDPENF